MCRAIITLLLVGLAASATKKYNILIATGGAKEGDTDDFYKVALHGTLGSTQEYLLDHREKDDKESNATDSFTVTWKDVGEIECVDFKLETTTSDDDNWQLNRVMILVDKKEVEAFDSGTINRFLGGTGNPVSATICKEPTDRYPDAWLGTHTNVGGLTDKCVKDNWNYKGENITSSNGVADMYQCISNCENTNDCESVTYLKDGEKTCTLKSKKFGKSPQLKLGVMSANIDCAIPAPAYEISVTIGLDTDDKTNAKQFVRIKGDEGTTEELECKGSKFTMLGQVTKCNVKSRVKIGQYIGVIWRTAANDKWLFTKMDVSIDGVKQKTYINVNGVSLANKQQKEFLLPAVAYTIRVTIGANDHDQTNAAQHVRIIGTKGITEERQCNGDFSQNSKQRESVATCTVESRIDIGAYKCVQWRTVGEDGWEFTKMDVSSNGVKQKTFENLLNVDLDNSETKPFCLPEVTYEIRVTIGGSDNDKTDAPQHVKIIGSKGRTEEYLCDGDFSKKGETAQCTVNSEADIGEYRGVQWRTVGAGWVFTKMDVIIDGVQQTAFDNVNLDDSETKDIVLTKNYNVIFGTGDHNWAKSKDEFYFTMIGKDGYKTTEHKIAGDKAKHETYSYDWTLENVGEIRCVEMKIIGTDGWDIERVIVRVDDKLTEAFDSGIVNYFLDTRRTLTVCNSKEDFKMVGEASSIFVQRLGTQFEGAVPADAWCKHGGKRLSSGYSSAPNKFDSYEDAQRECLWKKGNCGGLTYEQHSKKFTLRRGSALQSSPTNEISWKTCKNTQACWNDNKYWRGPGCCGKTAKPVDDKAACTRLCDNEPKCSIITFWIKENNQAFCRIHSNPGLVVSNRGLINYDHQSKTNRPPGAVANKVWAAWNGVKACSYTDDDMLVNLALKKPTSQSSIGSNGYSERAVDGNSDSNYRGLSCTHTNGRGWWSVDLLNSYRIKKIVIQNRVDCCSGRINGVKVYAGDKLCGTIRYTAGKSVYEIECDTIASHVKVENPTTHLTLCEVKVLGIPDRNRAYCVKQDWEYQGSEEITHITKVANIYACIDECRKFPDCRAVAYNYKNKNGRSKGNCSLKREKFGGTSKYMEGIQSANLDCSEPANCGPGRYAVGKHCLACPANQACVGGGLGNAPIACAADEVPSPILHSTCIKLNCPAGEYATNHACTACPVNKFCAGGLGAVATPCPAGSISIAGQPKCKKQYRCTCDHDAPKVCVGENNCICTSA